MSFLVFTDTDQPFEFEGQIGATKSKFVFHSTNGDRIYNTSQVAAVMRMDFAEKFQKVMNQLESLKPGNPNRN
jgi:hypothetical protein